MLHILTVYFRALCGDDFPQAYIRFWLWSAFLTGVVLWVASIAAALVC